MNIDYTTIENLIAQIDAATEANTVSNQMVARVLGYLHHRNILESIKVLDSISELPEMPKDKMAAYIVDGHLYVFVAEGGDTLGGLYQDCGELRGPKGDKGEDGSPGVVLDPDAVELFDSIDDIPSVQDPEKAVPTALVAQELARRQQDGDDEIMTALNGKSSIVDIRQSRWFHKDGYYSSSSATNYKVVVYDVTHLLGSSVTVHHTKKNNVHYYDLVRHWEDIGSSAAADYATENLLRAGSNASGTSDNYNVVTVSLTPSSTGYETMAEHVAGGGRIFLIVTLYKTREPDDFLMEKGLAQRMEDKQDKLVFDIEPEENSYNPVTSDGIYRMVQPVAQEVLGNDGSIGVLDIIRGKLINSNSTNIGYWASYTGYNSYAFDISNRVGQQVKVRLRRRHNTIMYAFVRNYADITNSLDSEAWAANRVSSKKASPNSESTGYVEYMLTVPLEAVHLVLSGTDSLPGMCIYPEDAEMGLDEIREIVEDLAGNTGTIEALNPSKEYLPKIKQMVHQRYFASGSPKWKTTPLLLAHFSDVHANGAALSRMIGWCSQYNDIADILHTGDAVSETLDDGMAFWDNAGAENVLNIVGNHDASLEDAPSQGTAPVADIYNALFAPYIDNWDVIQPEDAVANGLMYWYKDYAKNMVRLIGLDCMHKTSAQLEWLESVLVDAADKGLTVVIAYHSGPAASGTYNAVNCNFCDFTMTNAVYAYAWAALEAKVTAFKAGVLEGQTVAGDFACWLCGHSHKDYLLWTDSGQLIVGIDALTTGISGRTHTIREGEKSQDLFNLVGIDTYRHTVKLLRVGSDIDDQLRKIDQCTIDYTTGKVLGVEYSEGGGGGGGTLVQADWNQSDNSQPDYIKNKPTIPTVPTNVSAFTNDAGYLTQHQDISGKEDKFTVETVASGTTSLNADTGTYYNIAGTVGTLAITLPAVTDTSHLSSIVFFLTTGTTPALSLASADSSPIYYANYSIEADSTYEINALFNGTAWVMAAVKINVA